MSEAVDVRNTASLRKTFADVGDCDSQGCGCDKRPLSAEYRRNITKDELVMDDIYVSDDEDSEEDLVIDDIYISDDVSSELTMPGTVTKQMW